MNPDFTNNRRATLTLLAVLVLIGLFGSIIVYLFTSATPAAEQPADLYADIPFEPKLLAIDKQALDEAYHDQIKFLFSVWLKDGARNVKGATAGLKIARGAYDYAAAQIAKRERGGGK